MRIIKKNDVVVFQEKYIDPQSEEYYYIEHRYSLREYSEIKELIGNEILGEKINAN